LDRAGLDSRLTDGGEVISLTPFLLEAE
jgi:hypothetical protein